MNALWQDVRFALRQLSKRPAFSFIAVFTLALGIGANVAIFSVVNAVLLKPFAFAEPKRLVWIYSAFPDNARAGFTLPEFCDYRDQNTLFEGLGGVGTYNANLVDGDQPERVQGVRLSARIFQILGVQPLLGRTLVESDDKTGAPAVAVISYGLWSRHYGRQQNVIGRSVILNGEPCTIVGVLPPDFVLPNLDTEVAVPLQPDADPRRQVRNSVHFLRMVGRLKSNVTIAQGHAELDSIRQNLRKQFPEESVGNIGVRTIPLSDEIVSSARPMLITVSGAVGALLLIACANLASMSLVRAAGRQRELAVRSALGAARSQLIRLLLSESALLAFVGGSLGFLFAFTGSANLVRFVPTDLPRVAGLAVDYRVLFFTSIVILTTTVITGLAPAWLLSRADLRDVLASGRGYTGGANQSRLRHCLVAGQVGLALVLLASAGLFLRSFAQLIKEDPGFDPHRVLTVRLSLPQTGYPDRTAFVSFYDKLLPRLSTLPGVENVGVVSLLPLTRTHATINFSRPDRPPATRDETPAGNFRIVSPGYFAALKIPLVSGRDFNDNDDGDRPPVAIISQVLAKKYFPDRPAAGQRLLIEDTDGPPRPVQIVGVVADVKQERLELPATFDIYLPLRQVTKEGVPWLRNNSFCVLRASQPATLKSAVRMEIRNVDSSVPATNIRTMEEVMSSAVAARRFSLILLSVFAGAALILAAAGLYAVIAQAVGQRTREIGLRVALGATRFQILRLIVGEGSRLIIGGVVAGLLATVGIMGLLASQLYQVNSRDPLSFSFVTILLILVSLLACCLAAIRALRVDPATALRAE
jgi:putative ABC transport system permease protein